MARTPQALVDRIRKAMAVRRVSRLDEIYLADGDVIHVLRAGKWVRGRSEHNMRMDRAAIGSGILKARIFGRKKQELGALRLGEPNGHAAKVCLRPDDAEVLRSLGFQISASKVVGWTPIEDISPEKAPDEPVPGIDDVAQP